MGTVTNRQDYLKVWGDDNIVTYPRNSWLREFPAQADAYPVTDFIPINASVVFTSDLTDSRFELFDRINLDLGVDEVLTIVVIGAVPADPGAMLFGFEPLDGRVLLLGLEAGTLELVNSSFRTLTEFLYRFACFVDADTGVAGRAQRATELRSALMEIDPAAFTSSESWWSVALAQLGATVD